MSERKTWRDHAKPIIYKTIIENEGKPTKEIKKALRDAYPFGERKYHPYKIWCDEVRKQLGLKRKNKNIDTNQIELFP